MGWYFVAVAQKALLQTVPAEVCWQAPFRQRPVLPQGELAMQPP